MSIKKDNVNVTAVKYNSQDVNKVILDNKCVWCKPFTYTQGTLPTGVESLTCTRSSTDEPTALTGTIANGGIIYYYDKLYWEATASTGYRITAIKGSGSPITVSGAITGTTASGLTSERISGTISQGTLPTGVASITCYRKAYNENSFSEYTGSTIYYGDQFYWTATAATEYNNPSLTYNNSSKVYTWTGSQNGSIDSVSASGLSAGTRRSFTISFGTTANKSLYGSWSSSSQTAYYGDKITVSGTTVTCYKWEATSTARWTVTVSASSNTAEYTYSAVTIAESNIASVTAEAAFTAYNTRTLNSYTITWKYLSAYPDTWATDTESYNYGATPSRTASTVTSGNARKVPTGWDNLAAVTGNRTITANYKTQVNATFQGTRCSAKIDNAAVSNTWYDINKTVTWTANTNCAFSSDGSTTTTTDTISTQKTNYTASADYVNVTKLTGTNCSTNFTTGWKSITDKITWTAGTAYAFDTSNTTTSQPIAVVPGENKYTASYVKRYTLTISVTNGSYGTYSVTRDSSKYQGASTGALSNGDTIFYGDVLTGTSSAKAVSYDGWSVTSVTAPTATTTGDATSGNLTITNKSSYQATLYYNTSNAAGGTSAGAVAANGSKTVSGLNFNTQYYISARVSRTRTKHTYATDGDQYSGTNGVTENVTATFKFKDTTSTDTGTIDSSVVSAKTAAQNQYTVTWKYLSAYPNTWTTATQSYNYGATPSRADPDPSIVTSTSGTTRNVFTSWDDLGVVRKDRYIVACYKTQYAPTIESNYCTADRSSGTWYDPGTVITWTADDNYSFGGTTVKDTTTQTIENDGRYKEVPAYIKCTISGTNCQADKSNGSILKAGTDVIHWTGNTGTNSKYGFSNTNSNSTTANATVALGTTSYSKTASYLWYNVTSVSGTNCTAYINSSYITQFTTGWKLSDTSIYWKASAAYAFNTSNGDTFPSSISPGANTANASYVKRYTLSLTKNANVSSIKAWRTDSPYQGATIGSSSSPLINGTGTATIYYGDSLSMAAGAAANYHFPGGDNTKTNLTNTVSTVTRDYTWAPTVEANTYTVKCASELIGLSNVYLNTSSNATSGSSSLGVPYNGTVYGFAVLDSYVSDYQISNWALISGTAGAPGAIYRVGSKTITAGTTYYINLFEKSDYSSFVFKRSGLNAGSWTINTNRVDPADGYVKIRQSGTSIYADCSDSDGEEYATRLGTFTCPAGYTVSFTLTDYNGNTMSWNRYEYEAGPYIITARVEEDTTTT